MKKLNGLRSSRSFHEIIVWRSLSIFMVLYAVFVYGACMYAIFVHEAHVMNFENIRIFFEGTWPLVLLPVVTALMSFIGAFLLSRDDLVIIFENKSNRIGKAYRKYVWVTSFIIGSYFSTTALVFLLFVLYYS